jgi:dsDNA-specific endonuclease/ATPase MutS2
VCVKNPPRKGRVFCRLFFRHHQHPVVSADDPNEPIALPITGELDLHAFRPAEVTRLLDDYFAECRQRRIHRVRVIHGKGTGALRETVQAHLRRSRAVHSFAQGDETSGSWGATIVTLLPADSC